MARPIRVPVVDSTSEEVYLSEWLAAVGDHVESDQPVARMETDKAVVDILAPVAGTITGILVDEGDVEPGATIGELEED